MSLAIVVLGIVAVGLLFVIVPLVASVYSKWRGVRVVTCPENKETAAVEVDAVGATVGELLGRPHLELRRCSRWPERLHCGQECLREIESAPEGCLVRKLVGHWMEGKVCAYCGRLIDVSRISLAGLGITTADGAVLEWAEVPAERLPHLLSAGKPVCWDCLVAEKFRSRHPELVIDAPARHGGPASRVSH